MACILLRSCAVRVHDSQAYKKIDVTRGRISHSLELREMLLSFQTGFNLVNTAVVCVILESISGLEPTLDTTEPRYLKLVTVSSFSPFTLIFYLLMPLVQSEVHVPNYFVLAFASPVVMAVVYIVIRRFFVLFLDLLHSGPNRTPL